MYVASICHIYEGFDFSFFTIPRTKNIVGLITIATSTN